MRIKIELSNYNPKWKTDFETEKQHLISAIGINYLIEHIGSTAVKGLCAKPVIDILIGVDSLSKSEELIPKICKLGYSYISDYEKILPERRYFQKVINGKHIVHIHLVKKQTAFWEKYLLFRDILRQSPEISSQYSSLKQGLSKQNWDNRNAYTSAKSDFIQTTLKIHYSKPKGFQPTIKTQPILKTDRLILRPFSLDDANKVKEFCSDKRLASTTAHIPHPYENGVAEDWIKTHKKSFQEGKAMVYAITSKETQQLLGAISLIIQQSDECAEIGYWIGFPFWNKGYCTEAGIRIVQFGFEELNLNKIYGNHMLRNPSSGRVFEKMDMTQEGTLRQHAKKWDKFEDIALYAILKSKFFKKKQ